MSRWGTDRLAATRWAVCALIAALAVANAAFEKTQARGAANLSQAELRPIGDYMRHEIAGGKIPGAIVRTRMPKRASSRAAGSAMPTTPALDAE